MLPLFPLPALSLRLSEVPVEKSEKSFVDKIRKTRDIFSNSSSASRVPGHMPSGAAVTCQVSLKSNWSSRERAVRRSWRTFR